MKCDKTSGTLLLIDIDRFSDFCGRMVELGAHDKVVPRLLEKYRAEVGKAVENNTKGFRLSKHLGDGEMVYYEGYAHFEGLFEVARITLMQWFNLTDGLAKKLGDMGIAEDKLEPCRARIGELRLQINLEMVSKAVLLEEGTDSGKTDVFGRDVNDAFKRNKQICTHALWVDPRLFVKTGIDPVQGPNGQPCRSFCQGKEYFAYKFDRHYG